MNDLVTTVGAWAGGILSAVLVQQILNRRIVLSYNVHHYQVGAAADDKIFGDVRITWKGAAVLNLYLSTIELVNESTRDLQNVRFKAYTNDSTLLTEFSQLLGTTQLLTFAPEFAKQLEVPNGQVPTQVQWDLHGRNREYLLPVLNRGQVVKLQYLNTSKSEKQPTLWLDVVHPGVVVKYRAPLPQVLGVPAPYASLAGVLLGMIVASLLYSYSPAKWVIAYGCLLFGFCAQLPGAYAVKLWRAVSRWFAG